MDLVNVGKVLIAIQNLAVLVARAIEAGKDISEEEMDAVFSTKDLRNLKWESLSPRDVDTE